MPGWKSGSALKSAKKPCFCRGPFRVWFPEPLRLFTTSCHSSSKRSDAPCWTILAMHHTHKHTSLGWCWWDLSLVSTNSLLLMGNLSVRIQGSPVRWFNGSSMCCAIKRTWFNLQKRVWNARHRNLVLRSRAAREPSWLREFRSGERPCPQTERAD